MRLPVNRAAALAAVSLVALGAVSGPAIARKSAPEPVAANGPAADYPIVLGQPFTVDGVTYTPQDKLNYDQVGQAGIGSGEGVSISHRTLPIPSYAEVTSLESGRTILVRVTQRGPMTGARLIDLSPAAAAQLGTHPGTTPIRIRRVNPPEQERAMLRSGGQAPARMDTPKSLVAVLLRKLDPNAAPAPLQPIPPAMVKPVDATPPAPAPVVKPAKPAPVVAKPAAAPAEQPVAKGSLVIQVGAFSSAENARNVAGKVGGQVSPAGKLYRVRSGPYSSPAAAQAALAKVKAAGYSDARIQHAD